MEKINELLQKIENYFLTSFFNFITLLGGIIGVILIFYILLLKNKNKAYLYLIGITLGQAFIIFLKMLAKVNRPYAITPNVQNLDWQLFDLIKYNKSFPSGHSFNASFSLFFLNYNFKLNKFLKGILSTLLTLIILSRLYLGVHFITDVIAGFMFGFSLSLFLKQVKFYELKFNLDMFVILIPISVFTVVIFNEKNINNNYIYYMSGILTIAPLFTSLKYKTKNNKIILLILLLLVFESIMTINFNLINQNITKYFKMVFNTIYLIYASYFLRDKEIIKNEK